MIHVIVLDNVVSEVVLVDRRVIFGVDVCNGAVAVLVSDFVVVDNNELRLVMTDEAVLSSVVVIRVAVVIAEVSLIAMDVSELAGSMSNEFDDAVGETSDVRVVICSCTDSETITVLEVCSRARVVRFREEDFWHSAGL